METEQLTALDRLHRELNKLEPAITHIENTVKLTNLIETIPQTHVDFVIEQKNIETEFKDGLKSLAQKEFENVSKVLDNSIQELKSIAKELGKENNSLKNQITQLESIVKRIDDNDFPRRLTSIEGDLSSVSSSFNNVQGNINNLQADITRLDRNEVDHFNALKESSIENGNSITTIKEKADEFYKMNSESIKKLSLFNILQLTGLGILVILLSLLLMKIA